MRKASLRQPSTAPREYRIGLARREHARLLPAIEWKAAGLFPESDLPRDLRDEVTPVAAFAAAQRAGRLWVALSPDGAPVGFALVRLLDGGAHLEEMDVHPEHGRRGVGSSLVRAVLRWARRRDLPCVTLTTFEHLPWNAPFYARVGFRVLDGDEIGPELALVLREEARFGLRRRVVMRHSLGRTRRARPAGRPR